jgi:nucleotidyltransferase substrate binding protein (TIGR01987 family)
MVGIEKLDFSSFEGAVKTLRFALAKDSLSDLERDGAIQRFEYTFELAWKMMRRVLIALGRNDVSASPKPVFRDAVEEGLIKDANEWFAFLEARNLSTHIYNQDEAKRVFKAAQDFLPKADSLLKKLKALK